jgi:flagellar biosynthesis/type III secretory pathway protein FliH
MIVARNPTSGNLGIRLLKNPRLSATVFELPDRDVGSASARRVGIEAAASDPQALAYAQGRSEGEAAARSELEPRLAAAVADLAGAAAAIESARGELLKRAEEELVELAVAIARRVIATEVTAGREVAASLARRAIGRLRGAGAIRLLVHPSEVQRLQQQIEVAARDEFAGLSIEVDGSPLVAPGGVVARTTARTVDARIEAQLESVASELGLAAVDLAAAEALVGASELEESNGSASKLPDALESADDGSPAGSPEVAT